MTKHTHHRRPQPRPRRRLHVLRPGPRQDRHRRPGVPPRAAGHRDAQPPGAARRTGSHRRQHPRLRLPARQVRPAAERVQHGRPLRPDGRRPAADDDRATCTKCKIAVPGHADDGVPDAAAAAAASGFDYEVVPFDQIIAGGRGRASSTPASSSTRGSSRSRTRGCTWSSTSASGGRRRPACRCRWAATSSAATSGPDDHAADQPAAQGEHPLRAWTIAHEALRLRPAVRPRHGRDAGGPVRRHVRQRLDARLRPARPGGGAAALLDEGHKAGIIPQPVAVEFVE